MVHTRNSMKSKMIKVIVDVVSKPTVYYPIIVVIIFSLLRFVNIQIEGIFGFRLLNPIIMGLIVGYFFGRQIIKERKLHQLAIYDPLSGLYNRVGFTLQVSQFFANINSTKNISVISIDVDDFKSINDTYGHDVGDQVLQMVGMLMKKITGGGKVFRYGGEEFTVIFAGKHIHETKPHLEVLREAIANYQLVLRDQHRPVKKQPKSKKKSLNKTQQQTVSVAISIGVAERNEQHKTPEEVIKQADNALYRAKKNGRNCLSE